MLRLPNCDFCKYYIDDGETDRCLAYPDGIPLEAMIKAGQGVECANSYSFEEREESYTGLPKSDGFLSKMLNTFGNK